MDKIKCIQTWKESWLKEGKKKLYKEVTLLATYSRQELPVFTNMF